MGDESLVGVVDLMTGEKDPRNLMLAFSILKVLMVEWDIKNHIEVPPPICPRRNFVLTKEDAFRFSIQLFPHYLQATA
jgi:hypothetical protein